MNSVESTLANVCLFCMLNYVTSKHDNMMPSTDQYWYANTAGISISRVRLSSKNCCSPVQQEICVFSQISIPTNLRVTHMCNSQAPLTKWNQSWDLKAWRKAPLLFVHLCPQIVFPQCQYSSVGSDQLGKHMDLQSWRPFITFCWAVNRFFFGDQGINFDSDHKEL